VTPLFLDTETRSRVDIGLGHDLYTRAAKCMIVTYALNDQPAQIWQPWQDPATPPSLFGPLADSSVRVIAHNAAFDRLILDRCLGIDVDPDRWWCTMAQANAHGLPGSLETLGEVCGLPVDQRKIVDDYGLIDTFCVPQAATGQFIEPTDKPEEWVRFCRYAVRDTETLREIYKRLPTHNYTGVGLQVWHIDQLINERGFGFDRRLAQAATAFLSEAKAASNDVIQGNTQGDVHSASQNVRLLKYLREKCGVDIESLRASEVVEWLECDDLDPVVRVLLEQRLEAAKSSGAKYARGLKLVGSRDRMRHGIKFCGAGRTGRFSGKGFQVHNMARPVLRVQRQSGRIELTPVKASYIDEVILPGIYSKQALSNDLVYGGPHEAAALALRHVIVAAPGNELVVGDYKNIESVITAWCAGETRELEEFRAAFADPKNRSKDPYLLQWSRMFAAAIASLTETERQGGKVVKLAFGFAAGVGALVIMAAGYQLDLEPLAKIVLPRASEEQRAKAYRAWRRAFLLGEDYGLEPKVYQACDILKQVYRATNPKIYQMSRDLGDAVKESVRHPNTRVFNVARCKVWSTGGFLIIELPSGRRLLYAAPKLRSEEIKDPEGGPSWTSEYVTYATARGKSWRLERAWSGLFVENVVQAIAADILRAALLRVHADTLTVPEIAAYLQTLPAEERTAISLHVHDEVVVDVPKGSYSRERMRDVLTRLEPWMEGLPVAADTWVNERYGKR
jgi:DNA polymerase bacteriophage-type